jgi:hypothetical protein
MSDPDKTPAWVWIALYLVFMAVLASASSSGVTGNHGDGPSDDGCQSGVQSMGCFP